MSDTTSRNPASAPQMLADALLRSVAGASASLRVTSCRPDSELGAGNCELGLVATTFADVMVSPVVLRKLRPAYNAAADTQWELLVSASSVAQQVSSLELDSAQALFATTMAVTVAGQDYLIESVASNEAFGRVYLYRLMLREARQQRV